MFFTSLLCSLLTKHCLNRWCADDIKKVERRKHCPLSSNIFYQSISLAQHLLNGANCFILNVVTRNYNLMLSLVGSVTGDIAMMVEYRKRADISLVTVSIKILNLFEQEEMRPVMVFFFLQILFIYGII